MRYSVLTIIVSMLSLSICFAEGGIEVKDAWVRETPPGSKITALYMNINNAGDKDDTLVSVSTNVSKSAEIHNTLVDDKGVAKMDMIERVIATSGETVKFEPGGMHVMLIDLKHPLKSGDTVQLDLIFETAGKVGIEAKVLGLDAEMKHHQHHH